MNPNWLGRPAKNYPYIGDRQLDPDDEPDYCEYCDGFDVIYPADGSEEYPCPECQGDSGPGEPNEDPE